jgi:hypothetical protein
MFGFSDIIIWGLTRLTGRLAQASVLTTGAKPNVMARNLVGNRGLAPTGVSNGTDPMSTYRVKLHNKWKCVNPAIVFGNFSCNSAGSEVVATTVGTYSFAIEYPQGVVHPYSIGGSSSKAVSPRAIAVTDGCGITLPDDTDYWVRICVSQDGSTVWPTSHTSVVSSGNGGADGDAAGAKITGATKANPCIVTCSGGHNLPTGTTPVKIANVSGMTTINGSWTATYISATTFSIPVDTTAAGTFSGFATLYGTDMTKAGSGIMSSAIGTITMPGPLAVIGDFPYGENRPWAHIFGDSIARGSGDTANSEGYIVAGLGGTNTPSMPWMNLAVPGTRISQFVDATNSPTQSDMRKLVGLYAPYAFVEFVVNDINNGRSAQQVANDLLTLGKDLYARGTRVIVNTCSPYTPTSTDSYATAGGQTPGPNEVPRTTFNDWIRAGCPIDPVTLQYVTVGTDGALVVGADKHPFWQAIDPWAAYEVNAAGVLTVNGGRWMAWGQATKPVTADITSGSAQINVTAAPGANPIMVGQAITGSGLGAGSYVLSFGTGNGGTGTYNLNVPATATTSGATLTLATAPTVDGTHPATVVVQGAKLPVAALLPYMVAF